MTDLDPTEQSPAGDVDVASRDAAALLLGLATLLEGRTVDEAAVHLDLLQSSVLRLRRAAAGLTGADPEDLPDQPSPEGRAWAYQLVTLWEHSHSHDGVEADRATTVNESPDPVTEALDRSGIESFPASDPPSR